VTLSLLDQFRETTCRYQFDIGDTALEQLAEYVERLWSWNEKINLTRHTTVEKFVTRDLVDVLQLAEQIDEGCHVLDMGTGGGVPGIPLAILRPDLKVSLSESIGKKARVVEDIVQQMGLAIPVHARRTEEVLNDHRFDYVVARAIGPLWKICRWLEPHWFGIRALLAVKGPKWLDERKEARHRGLMRGLQLRKVAEYKTPDDEPRYSVILRVARAAE
jgi:16S rRNA (guanine527-N7)-methyltransferase